MRYIQGATNEVVTIAIIEDEGRMNFVKLVHRTLEFETMDEEGYIQWGYLMINQLKEEGFKLRFQEFVRLRALNRNSNVNVA